MQKGEEYGLPFAGPVSACWHQWGRTGRGGAGRGPEGRGTVGDRAAEAAKSGLLRGGCGRLTGAPDQSALGWSPIRTGAPDPWAGGSRLVTALSACLV